MREGPFAVLERGLGGGRLEDPRGCAGGVLSGAGDASRKARCLPGDFEPAIGPSLEQPFTVINAGKSRRAIAREIADPALRALPIIGSLDQVAGADLGTRGAVARATRHGRSATTPSVARASANAKNNGSTLFSWRGAALTGGRFGVTG